MTTLNVSFQELKQGASEYLKSIPNLNKDQLDNGHKTLCLMYLGLEDNTPEHEIHQGVLLFSIIERKVMEREFELINKY